MWFYYLEVAFIEKFLCARDPRLFLYVVLLNLTIALRDEFNTHIFKWPIVTQND